MFPSQDTRWPKAVLETIPYEVAPVPGLLDIPLRVTRVKPLSDLVGNQWATWMMIEPVSGFAPPHWQSHVGPVVVWQPNGAVSSHDMALLNDFLSMLLLRYSEGPGAVVPVSDLEPNCDL